VSNPPPPPPALGLNICLRKTASFIPVLLSTNSLFSIPGFLKKYLQVAFAFLAYKNNKQKLYSQELNNFTDTAVSFRLLIEIRI